MCSALAEGMHVRVWVETIWPGPKAVAILYDGVFVAWKKERTQPVLFQTDCPTPNEQNKNTLADNGGFVL